MDGLTNIANRRFFENELEKVWNQCKSDSIPLSLILEIDYYKQDNDTYGHLSGDACLIEIAQSLSKLSLGHDFTARYGGEEFVLVLAGADRHQSNQVAISLKDIVAELSIPHQASPISDIVTISIGIATLIPNPGMNQKDLIAYEDDALYEAKSKGRNTLVPYK
ncbi:diguanylate cyclase [Peribacillus alkalitolerans]|uniref:diguanylate cyclase n=1 Tax=Peribacillus alkalitolerans TaxID=1550385 RepID=UPI0013D23261|nr:diguanylate cyclase [Peribacillus alkalitolerans]